VISESIPVQEIGDIPPLIDLHCHLLPGVDDGARTAEQSAQVVRNFWNEGVREVCLTPHLLLSETAGATRAARVALCDRAHQALLAATGPSPLRIWRGCELMIDEPPSDRHDLSAPLTLGASRALLIEFSHSITHASVSGTVRALRDRGLVPLIAHPERYECCSPHAVDEWRHEGAWIQCDATSAAFGTHWRGPRARELLSFGLVDMLAGDNHGDDRSLTAAYRHLVAAGNAAAAERLCSAAARALLEGGERLPPLSVALVATSV